MLSEFHTLPPDERRLFETQALHSNCSKRAKIDGEASDASDNGVDSYEVAVGDALWGLSSSETPIRPDVLDREACRLHDGRPCGFTRMQALRSEFLKGCFVADEGA